jgi:hypothetical protein
VGALLLRENQLQAEDSRILRLLSSCSLEEKVPSSACFLENTVLLSKTRRDRLNVLEQMFVATSALNSSCAVCAATLESFLSSVGGSAANALNLCSDLDCDTRINQRKSASLQDIALCRDASACSVAFSAFSLWFHQSK